MALDGEINRWKRKDVDDYIYLISYKNAKKANPRKRICPYWKTISQALGLLQNFWYIAETCNLALRIGMDDITSFEASKNLRYIAVSALAAMILYPYLHHIRAGWIKIKAEVKTEDIYIKYACEIPIQLMERRWDLRFAFFPSKPIFLRIFFLWVSTVLGDIFIKAAIFLVV